MKRIVVLCSFACVVLCGCATSPVIGPFSYMTAQSNKKASIRRAALQSQKLTFEEKKRVVSISAYTTSPTEIGMAVKVDVLELLNGNYTTSELLKQASGVVGDVTLYSAVIYALQSLSDDDSSDDPDGHDVTVNGDYNNVNVTQGNDNTSTSDDNSGSSGGESNQDTETVNP
jgi:hypothetical protein